LRALPDVHRWLLQLGAELEERLAADRRQVSWGGCGRAVGTLCSNPPDKPAPVKPRAASLPSDPPRQASLFFPNLPR
jgi:hypothetical protein